MDWATAIIVFATMAIFDYVCVRYYKSLFNNERLKAASYSALLVVLGSVSIISYEENRLYVIPAALGAALGVYLGMPSHQSEKSVKHSE